MELPSSCWARCSSYAGSRAPLTAAPWLRQQQWQQQRQRRRPALPDRLWHLQPNRTTRALPVKLWRRDVQQQLHSVQLAALPAGNDGECAAVAGSSAAAAAADAVNGEVGSIGEDDEAAAMQDRRASSNGASTSSSSSSSSAGSTGNQVVLASSANSNGRSGSGASSIPSVLGGAPGTELSAHQEHPPATNGAPAAAPQPDAAAAPPAAAEAPAAVAVAAVAAAPTTGGARPPWPPDVPWGLGKVAQVMGLWLLAYAAMGQVLVPALLALLDVDQARLSARGAALLNLALDIGQVAVTLLILRGCLKGHGEAARKLFPIAWRGGGWVKWVAAGAAAFPLVDLLAHGSAQLLLLLLQQSAGDGGAGLVEAAASGAGGAPVVAPVSVPAPPAGPVPAPAPPPGVDVWTAQIESGLCDRDWLTCAAYVAVVSLCAPLWEEAIFRGFLLPSLAPRLGAPGAALASALVFATCHFRAETFAPLLLLGLVFGGLYVRTGNLLPPMALHSLWNLYVLGTLVLRWCGYSALTASLVLAAGTQAMLGGAGLLLAMAARARRRRLHAAQAAAAATAAAAAAAAAAGAEDEGRQQGGGSLPAPQPAS